jgi:hypothetical protein
MQVLKSVKDCLKALTGEVPDDPVEGHASPGSSLGRPSSHSAGAPGSLL